MKVMRSNRASSLVEVIVATAIFLLAAVGLLYSYLKCMELDELGRNAQQALAAINSEIEIIKNTDFANIVATYDNATFNAPAGITGIGKIYIDTSNSDLLLVKVVFCWRQSNRRVIGEDTNLNGSLDAGEDKNGNNEIDSYVQVYTQIYG